MTLRPEDSTCVEMMEKCQFLDVGEKPPTGENPRNQVGLKTHLIRKAPWPGFEPGSTEVES